MAREALGAISCLLAPFPRSNTQRCVSALAVGIVAA